MQIIPSPIRHDTRLSAEIEGHMLILNGHRVDLSQIGEESVDGEILGSEWILAARRDDGEIVVRLLVPHGAQAPDQTLFPAPIKPRGNGPVSLPRYSIED